MSYPTEFYSSGTKPTATDTRRVLLEKILLSTNASGGGGGGGGGSGGSSSGPGNPSGPPTGGNGTYLNTSDGTFWAWNPALGSWLELIA